MSTLDQITKLKKKVGTLRSDRDKAKGHLERLQAQLAEKFNCDSVEDATKLLSKLTKKSTKAEEEFKKELAKFQKQWPEE